MKDADSKGAAIADGDAPQPRLRLVPFARRQAEARRDLVTSQRVEVGMIFQAMLGDADAAEYMSRNGVAPTVAQRVLTQALCRRGCHDVSGIRTDTPLRLPHAPGCNSETPG